MKKAIVAVLSVLMLFFALSVFAGGGQEKQEGDSAQISLTFADWLSAQDAFRPAMVEALDKYQETHPNVKLTHLTWQYEQYQDQLFVLLRGMHRTLLCFQKCIDAAR